MLRDGEREGRKGEGKEGGRCHFHILAEAAVTETRLPADTTSMQ